MLTRGSWWPLVLIAIVIALGTSPCGATVHTGAIVDLPEWSGPYLWGDGIHVLYQKWSIFVLAESGYFYGSWHLDQSNAAVHVVPGLMDPTTITDAASFVYSTDYVTAREGDCVFFRGTNGYYGAWRIDAIDPLPAPGVAKLNGQWYFQDDGTGSFSSSPTAVSPSTWGAIKGLYR